jgi:hypothetical protein
VSDIKRAAFVLLWTAGALHPSILRAADLTPATIAAFDRYVSLTERRLDDVAAPFLWVESRPAPQREAALMSLRRGELVIEPVQTKDGTREVRVDHGMIHHWMGVMFVRGATLDAALALLQDYDHHHEIYQPNVARSRLVSRNGSDFRIQLRFVMKKVITVVVDSEHDARFTREGVDRAASRSHSTRIAEVDRPGTAAERELPVGHDSGYLWRLNSYWRMLERDGGVYIQCETISLTRDVPVGMGWLIRPLVTSIPRETLTFTLQATRDALRSRSKS